MWPTWIWFFQFLLNVLEAELFVNGFVWVALAHSFRSVIIRARKRFQKYLWLEIYSWARRDWDLNIILNDERGKTLQSVLFIIARKKAVEMLRGTAHKNTRFCLSLTSTVFTSASRVSVGRISKQNPFEHCSTNKMQMGTLHVLRIAQEINIICSL